MEFMKKFKPEENLVKEFKYWIVLLREKQVTLGATVIVLKRDIQSLSQIKEEEAAEFPEVIEWFEECCTSIFEAQKFNYVVAMMKDNFVHYHAFPRYGNTFFKYGIEWKDESWPKVIEFSNVKYENDILEKIKSEMRNY